MTVRARLLACLCVMTLVGPPSACGGGPSASFSGSGRPDRVGSLLAPDEGIVGRASLGQGRVLLTDSGRLLQIDTQTWQVSRSHVTGLRGVETLWGLAFDADERMYTLLGHRTLARVSRHGAIETRHRLQRTALNLFGWNGQLVVHEATPEVGAPVLTLLRVHGADAEQSGRPVGTLRVADYATRIDRLALNLARCGSGNPIALPCWFSHSVAINLATTRDGAGLAFEPEGLGLAPPTHLTIADLDRPGPIRDVYLTDAGTIWILASPTRGAEAESRLQLARYTEDGELVARTELDGHVRMILSARGRRCVLVTGAGTIVDMEL